MPRSIVGYSIALLTMLLSWGPAAADVDRLLRLATTTSTDNSGLLAYLLTEFERSTGFRVHVIAVGTGKALRMGRDGDVDVVLVHAPEAETVFVSAGYGVQRRGVMYNDFLLVGPESDPAGVRQAGDVTTALQRIAEHRQPFVSRGDDSGTHKKELSLWRSIDTVPSGAWYREAGQGMGKVLQIAGEMDAYTLTDRGTWLAYQNNSVLSLLFQGDPRLHNPYGIIAINPTRYPNANTTGALALIEWITSREGQHRIGSFRIDGTRLFTPSAPTGLAETETVTGQ